MVQTRSNRTKKQRYYGQLKTSKCRKLSKTACSKRKSCKNTKSGRRPSYCRRTKNARYN